MKIVMITKLLPRTHYSRYLFHGLRNANKNINIVFYTAKGEKVCDIPQVKQVWTSNLYPLQVFRNVLKDRPDVVHIQHEFNMFGPFYSILLFPFLLFLLRFASIKTVVTVHVVVPLGLIDKQSIADLGSFKVNVPPILVKIAMLLIYKPLELASAVIVHDRCFSRVLTSSYKIKEEKVHVIPLGVDRVVNLHINETIVKKWSKKFAGKKVILYFGYIVPRKGLEYLLDAYAQIAKKYQNYVLVLAGGILPYHKDYVNKIVELIARLNLSQHVVITGFITDEEIHALYYLADFIVLPYVYSISSSLALSFAIQHKKPVIATNIGAFREEIKDGKDGLLCSPRSSEAIKEALIKMIENPSLREKFSRNLNEEISERSWCNVGKKTYELYEAISK